MKKNLTDQEKVRLIEAHFAKQRQESPDGKTSWDRVEDFRLKHGHLPSDSSAPCKECFSERTKVLIDLATMTAERDALKLAGESLARQVVKMDADRDTLRRENEALRVALVTCVAHEVDYMTRNNLGDPEQQSYIIMARAALKG